MRMMMMMMSERDLDEAGLGLGEITMTAIYIDIVIHDVTILSFLRYCNDEFIIMFLKLITN